MPRVINFPLKVAIFGTDEKVQRKLNRLVGEREEFDVTFFEDSKTLLEASKSSERTFSIYILDFDVEKSLHGEMENTLREIRDLKTGHYFILFGPNESLTFTVTCFRLGVHRYILKPFKVKELEEALEAAVKLFQHWDDLFEIFMEGKSAEREFKGLLGN